MFVLPPWCMKPLKTVLDLVYLKKDRTYAYVYQQRFMEIRAGTVITCLFIQMVHGMDILWFVLQFDQIRKDIFGRRDVVESKGMSVSL